MVNTQVILRYKVTITKALYDYGHCLIQVKNNGKGLTIEELSSEEARKMINENSFTKVKKEEYDYLLGDIYTDGKFKRYVNLHPDLKQRLIKIIETLDEMS